MYGTSAASQGASPRHNACAMPNLGLGIYTIPFECISANVLRILRPKRFEMNRQTDLSSTVHFGRFPFEFRYFDFW